MRERPAASTAPLIPRCAEPDAVPVQAPRVEPEAPSWPLPRTIALVAVASAALWLMIFGLSRRLTDWLAALPAF
jgi:hypothetical protein